jgi:segregation and condensation protein A
MFEVKSEAFSGPMEKLLELIEERHIEISRVNLATVTGDFIAYIEKLGEVVSPTILSDFVVVASRLLVLKSKMLLPTLELTGEEEADIMDLEHRLRLYREFKVGGTHLKALWDRNTQLFARPLLKSLGDAPQSDTGGRFFYPSEKVSQAGLKEAAEKLLHVMAGLMPEQKTVRGTIVTLQEKIMELTKRLSGAANVTLRGRVSKKEKEEVIVLFLAVLHMLANRLADVEQGDAFGDIVVTPPNNAEPIS